MSDRDINGNGPFGPGRGTQPAGNGLGTGVDPAFLLTDSFRDATILAVNLGGKTDAVGWRGAIAGAYHGYREIPIQWVDALENGAEGRE